jgi:hypothetical protein
MKSLLLCVSVFIASSLYAAPCSPGYFNATDGTNDLTPCFPCPVGQYASSPGSLSCTDCEVGTYTAFSATAICTDCQAGYYQDLTGQTFCKPCEAGTMAPNPGADVCDACPAGTNSIEAASGCNILSASGGSGCVGGRIGPTGGSPKQSYDLLFLMVALAVAMSPLCYVRSRCILQKRS